MFILSWVSWLGCLEYIFSPRDISCTNSSWFPHFINKRQVVGLRRRCLTTFILLNQYTSGSTSVVNRGKSLKKTKILKLKFAFIKLRNIFIKIGNNKNRYIVTTRSFMQCFWTVLWSFFWSVFLDSSLVLFWSVFGQFFGPFLQCFWTVPWSFFCSVFGQFFGPLFGVFLDSSSLVLFWSVLG